MGHEVHGQGAALPRQRGAIAGQRVQAHAERRGLIG